MANSPAKRTPRALAGNILIYLPATILIGSAIAKLAQIPAVVANMSALGFGGSRLTLIAILEVICALLFIFPRSRSLGLFLVSAYMGGAIATHVGHGQTAAIQPAILLGITWFGVWLRHPQVLWRADPA